MGQGSSLLADEQQSLLAFSSEAPVAFDSELWLNVFRFKVPLDLVPPKTLAAEFKDFCERLARNNVKTRNLATLAAHVATRLPRTWYFSATDIELTINAIVLLRLAFSHLAATCTPADLRTHLAGLPNPGATPNAEVDGLGFDALTCALLDFIAHTPVTDTTYELHTQALTLVLALLSTQVAHGTVAEAASLLLELPGGRVAMSTDFLGSEDPFLHAAMIAGHAQSSPPSTAATAAKGSKASAAAAAASIAKAPVPAAPQQRAAALVKALLRNISVDGARVEDGPEPEPSDSTSAWAASEKVVEARQAAVSAWDTVTHTVRLAKTGGSLAGKAADAVSKGVLGLATSLIAVPGAVVGTLLPSAKDPTPRPLAERSALVLLLLTHNCRSGLQEPNLAALANPYRAALASVEDSVAEGRRGKAVPLVGVPFKGLFKALAALCDYPLGTALLYTLMQTAPAFADHMFTRADIDEVLLPCLQQLYRLSALGPDHRYILLITLLIFTQDAGWCENAHKRVRITSTDALSWFRERKLGPISLGSLLVVLLTRVVLSSAGPVSAVAAAGSSGGATAAAAIGADSYLHTNCFAALANMAPYVENLHPYAASRLIAALQLLLRRYKQLVARLAELSAAGAGAGGPGLGAPHQRTATHETHAVAQGSLVTIPIAPAGNETTTAAVGRLTGLVEHYDQCIRILCEVILALCAPVSLPSNAAILYALLHDRSVPEATATERAFTASATPILDVTRHFAAVVAAEEHRKLAQQMVPLSMLAGAPSEAEAAKILDAKPAPPPEEAAPTGGAAPLDELATGTRASSTVVWGAGEVQALLVTAARVWQGGAAAASQAASLRETKFTYEEDTHPELFFAPYLWATAFAYTSDMAWFQPASAFARPGAVRLFPLASTKIYVMGAPTSDEDTAAAPAPSASGPASGVRPAQGGRGPTASV